MRVEKRERAYVYHETGVGSWLMGEVKEKSTLNWAPSFLCVWYQVLE